MLATLLLTAAVGFGASHLRISTDYRIFFSDENPELIAFEQLEGTFGKADNLAFVVFPKDGDIYGPEVVAAVHALTERAWTLPLVSRVDSLTNFQNTYAEADDLIVEPLAWDPAELTAEDYPRLRAIAEGEPLLHRFVTAEAGAATVVNAILQTDRSDPASAARIAEAARAMRADIEAAHPSVEIELVGIAMISHAFAEAGQTDAATLLPAMYGLIIVIMVLALRSVTATLTAVALVALSAVIGMGAGGWLGVALTPISLSAPTIILTIAVADSVHVIAAVRQRMRRGLAKREAVIEAMEANAFPVSLTSLTTIVGFLSLGFSDSPPFHHLGWMSAAGIAGAWLFSLTFLPAMLSFCPLGYKPVQEAEAPSPMAGFARWVVANKTVCLAGASAACLGFMAMIPSLTLNDVWSKYFDHRLEVRNAIDATQPVFGTDTVEFVMTSAGPGEVLNVDFLKSVDGFAAWLRERPEVTHVNAVTDVMRRLNMNLNADDPAFYAIPDNQQLAAQYLLVYELSLPYGLALNDRIDLDRTSTRITATIRDLSTDELRVFLAEGTERANANPVNGVPLTAHASGANSLFAYVAERNIRAMFNSAAYLMAAIALIMVLAFRSLSYGAISLIPNALPVLATFGVWATLVGTVGFSVAIVGAVAVGLVIDYAVHILSKYRDARDLYGRTPEEAVVYAFETAGVAILATTVILAAGFALLAGSAFKLNVDLGLMTAIAIVLSVIVNFFVLPALLVWRDQLFSDIPPAKEPTHAAA